MSVYSRPDIRLWHDSIRTVWACEYQGDADIRVVLAGAILEVVSMQPLPSLVGEIPGRWFVIEKSGLDDGILNDMGDEDEES